MYRDGVHGTWWLLIPEYDGCSALSMTMLAIWKMLLMTPVNMGSVNRFFNMEFTVV